LGLDGTRQGPAERRMKERERGNIKKRSVFEKFLKGERGKRKKGKREERRERKRDIEKRERERRGER
jgi:hypothetical protein